jgi:hypothetical protein
MTGHLTQLLVTMLLFSVAVAGFPDQNAPSASTQESVVLTKLFPPVYQRMTGRRKLTRE